MAKTTKSNKSAKGNSQTADVIAEEEQTVSPEDQKPEQEVIDPKPDAAKDKTDPEASEASEANDDDASTESAETVADGDIIEPTPEPDPVGEAEDSAAPIAAEDTSASAPSDAHRASALPLILGGVIAAIIGYAAAQVLPGNGGSAEIAALQEQLEQQDRDIDGLRAELGAIEPAPTPAADGLEDQIAELRLQVTDLSTRLTDLEQRAGEEGGAPSELTTALQAEVAQLRAQMSELASSGATQLDSARQALLRAATTRIATAIDSGEGFVEALREFTDNSDMTPPDTLSDLASTGVATEAELRQGFAPAARDAIAAKTEARIASGELSRVSGFLQQQLGMRSLSPREGDDADAILSRAEGALDRGDLPASLAELENLPPSAAPAMQDWIALAKNRLAALAGITDLTDALNSN